MKTHDPARACVSRFVFLPIQPSPRARPARARPAAGRRRTQHRLVDRPVPEGRRRRPRAERGARCGSRCPGRSGRCARSARRVWRRTGPRARQGVRLQGPRPLGRRRRRSRHHDHRSRLDRGRGSVVAPAGHRPSSPCAHPARGSARLHPRAGLAAAPHRSRRRAPRPWRAASCASVPRFIVPATDHERRRLAGRRDPDRRRRHRDPRDAEAEDRSSAASTFGATRCGPPCRSMIARLM